MPREMDQDERQRKLEFGRAKLANYRQRRAKGDSAIPQKKAPKRKGKTVQANEQSAQESTLEDPQSSNSHGKDNSEESVQADGPGSDPAASECNEEMDRTDAQERSSLPGDEVEAKQPAEPEDLGDIVVAHTSREQLKQLQAAVEKRNEIISQLSIKLQAALTSRDQVQLEAQQLTGQIQELQKQLQQANEYLRSKCVGRVDVCQAQQNQRQLQIDDSQQVAKDQQCLLEQKETEITALQQKLGVMEHSLTQLQSAFTSNNMDQVRAALLQHHELLSESTKIIENAFSSDTEALLQRLRSELDEERQNSRHAWDHANHLQKTVTKFESERSEMESRLAAVQAELEKAQARVHEAQQYKSEKEQLNRDVARLDGLVQELQGRLREEEEKAECLGSEHDAEIAKYELRLQTMEEERAMDVNQMVEAHEAALKRLREEHSEEVMHVRELLDQAQRHNHSLIQNRVSEELGASLNWGKTSKDKQNQDTACESAAITGPSLDASFTDNMNDMMERYLATAVQHESSLVDQSVEEHSLVENSKLSNFELDSEVMFAELSIHQHTVADGTDPELSLCPKSKSEDPPLDLAEISFTQAQWKSFASASQELNESRGAIELAKELLTQQCRDLMDELEQRERDLAVLQEEVRHSAEELEEARERWSKVSEELEETKWELETEREKRLQCEEIISQKTHEQDNLKNKLSYLESELKERITPDHVVLGENTSAFPSADKLLKEMKEENVKLVLQLKQQEQMIRDIQEQKDAGDSVSSEVHVQMEQLTAQLRNQTEKCQTTSVLLGQKTLEVDSANREIQQLRAEMEMKLESVQQLEKTRVDLESELSCLKQNLTNMEEALSQGAVEKAALERRLQALAEQMESMEKVLESELKNFELLLEAKDEDLKQMQKAKDKAEEELMEKESILQGEITALKQTLNEQEEEKSRLEDKHQKEVLDSNLRMERELSTLRASLEEEQKKKISLIKQVHEREHQRALSQQSAQQQEELDQLRAELSEELRDSMEAAHQAELSQVQMQQALELEALRLSLTNQHTSQLELSLANLQKEKEAALSELQATLREKWAQESAMLQTRQQFELERIREQSREQERQIQLKHQQEINDLKLEGEKRLSDERTSLEQEQAKKLEEAKIQWLQEAGRGQSELQSHLEEAQQKLYEIQAALTKAEATLTETQNRLEELQQSKEQELKHLETELSQAWADRDSAARAVEELVASHKVVLQEQQAHARKLEEREKQLQQEVDRLLTEIGTQKNSSEKEISNLWAQLESMRTSRQELGELKEQLLARSSRVEDMERMKQEFLQQRQELQEQNEVDLENLRTYFEQRLRSSEESHREEIALLQLRLVEGALEESILKTADSSFLSDGKGEEERDDALAEITEQLEKHKTELDALRLQLEEKHQQDLEQLRCSMALSYKEELLQARAELTDRYYSDVEQLNTKHALEIEQLRAKLSDNHIKEITKMRLQSATEAARQVEEELEKRARLQNQEYEARLGQLATEAERILDLEKRLAELTLQHAQELQRATAQHADELRELEDRLQNNFAEDLRVSLEEERSRASETQSRLEEQLASLREELQRAAEERGELKQKLTQSQELLAVERERLRALQASLDCEESPQLVAMKQKLQAQYEMELRTAKSTMAAEVKELNALLQEQTETKLKDTHSRHQEEQKQLEIKLTQQRQLHTQEMETQKALLEERISKLQHLEKECQELKTRHKEEFDLLSADHKAALKTLEAELTEKHRDELDKLQIVFQKTNVAQLEAQEAELVARHKHDLDELEKRMLCNMDSLENSYLKEIQALQEEKEEALRELELKHAGEMENVKREELDRGEELAQAHQDMLSAMAAELRQAHQEELSAALLSQKAALDADHCSALQTLQEHVLELEKQHSAALQEITEMTTAEKQKLQQQLDLLTAQHQQQLQELRGASSREIEALHRELEEETSRQRLHFVEEAELLKCQSEDQLQQRIAQIKEDSEREKAAALQELEKSLQEQHQQNELSYSDKMNQLTAQLQQLDTVVSQLRTEVSGLQGELEGKRSEMDTLETLLLRRERESQEGANLVSMLRDDLSTATQQRQDLQLAYERIQHILLEMLRSTMMTEEQINRKLVACIEGSPPGDDPPCTWTPKANRDSQETEVDSSALPAAADCSLFSVTDEGLELSQRLCESLFSGPEGEQSEREELVLGTCTRLRTAVDKLLDLVVESTQQLEQARVLQVALDERFSEGGEARNAILMRHTQLMEQLDHDASLKSQLQLELHKAEGLIEGYVAEKAVLEEALQEKEAQEQRLVKELESTRTQLHDLSENHTLLQRQSDALSAGLGDTEKGHADVGEEKALLAETKRLGQERVDVQCQAEKDRGALAARVRMLEMTLEEHESRAQQLEEQHRAQTEDLQQHLDALEKQLKHHRQFIDEQAVEREHERDEFQQEIKNLESQLRLPSKVHAGGGSSGQRIEDLVMQVESLQALINDKTEDYSVLLSAKEQCQRDLEERNEEIDKLASRIRELEQALLSSAEAGRMVTHLEQELQKGRKSLQELSQDKEALQQQLYSNKLQISALQSKLDETRHRVPDPAADPSLRQELEALQQELQSKEDQAGALLVRVEELEKALAVREENIGQLTLQLELSGRESRACEEQLQLQITKLEDTVSALRRQQEEEEECDVLQLPAALLEEKNLEIDHLNEQIVRLQQELDTIRENKIMEEKQAELEELRAQVERLRGDQERLRQEKDDETEQLHEVIHKLQEELNQLDPSRHEVSDPSPEPPDSPYSLRPQESLCHELNSQSLRLSRARLGELQAELERSAEEKEALQRLLLSQEEQYGQQVAALGHSLGEERGRLALLEEEAAEMRSQLDKGEAEAEELRVRVRELEDAERVQQVGRKDLELRLRRAEEKREEVQAKLEEARRQEEERERLEERVAELDEEVKRGRADIAALEMGKQELYAERQALRKREGKLQEEIERLRGEVKAKSDQIWELKAQLEERVVHQEEAQKEVLTCAEETLAKAETALREREEQLSRLRVEHDTLRVELAAVKEGLSSSTERAEKLQEEGQTKDRALADLEVHNQHLRAELRSLQDDLAVQEEELAYQQRELEELQQRCRLREFALLPGPKHEHRFLEGLSCDASLSSPEVLRRLDCSEERPSRIHASHLSELSALRDVTLELGTKPSSMDRERNDTKSPSVLPSETEPASTHSPSASPRSLSVSENLSVLDSLDADKVQELENMDAALSHSLGSASPVSAPEWASDGYGSNVSSEVEAKLNQELDNMERLDGNFVAYLRGRGIAPAPHSTAGSLQRDAELLSPELQAMLKRVYQESCRVLSLSHRPAPTGRPCPDSEEVPPPSWQRERRALQETVLSLRDLLCRMAEREPKTDDGGNIDWRRELLQAVRSVFDSEREWLHAQLQSVMASNSSVDHTALLEHLEKLLHKQEEHQRSCLEQLLSADRSSLLAEIRSLHAQLHSCTLQSQEQLRDLQNLLHAVREQGVHTQQQLQGQVEELEKRVQQAQMLSRDLQRTVEEEQTHSTEKSSQLENERKTVLKLKAELEETSAQLQSACKNQEELLSQVHTLRLKLENKVQEHQAYVESVEREQARVKDLQEELHNERVHHKQVLDQSTQAQQSLCESLSEQASRLNQLSSALEQERVSACNLRSELQIEQSRSEALLTRERERAEHALSQLNEERSRAADLSAILSRQAQEHAEQIRSQEAASALDRNFILELRAQLEQERKQAEEVAVATERLRTQELQAKREREEEAEREREEVKRLRMALEELQAQQAEVGRALEMEKWKGAQLQTELDAVKERMRVVQERERKREEERRRERLEQEDRERRQERTKEKLVLQMELEVLRERDQQHLRKLQQTLSDLEQQEKKLTSERLQRELHSMTNHTHITHTQDLSSSSSSLMERVLKENSDLAERLAALSEEKISLKHTVACLERDMNNLKRSQQERSPVRTDSSALAGNLAWQKEKLALQAALYKAQADLSKATASNENRPVHELSNHKLQRLYEKYLRAESYRKSLVYQKRYLLLLLGGFQDCEQATLALIARMGALPSPNLTQASRPLTRFRSSVRVVIAISRMKFLTRKWQRATRKNSIGSANVNTAVRTEVLKPQQPVATYTSPPTREHIFTQRPVISPLVPAVNSPFRLHNRGYSSSVLAPSERTVTSSQDQERSLAEYIQHLETVQHRLGAIRPGSPSILSYPRKSDR